MKRNADYVSGKRGAYRVQPPIIHPAECVCRRCKTGREPWEWGREKSFRVNRVSPYATRVESAEYARAVKREEEERLRAAVQEARSRGRAVANAVPFVRVCAAYRQHMQDEGKRYDRARHLIDGLEWFYGADRDAQRIGWAEYQELRSELANVPAQTQRHYVDTLLAILNYGVAERIIVSHELGKVRRPRVPRPDRPTSWTRQELGVLTGVAMDTFEREQTKREGSRASVMPLRGLCLTAYFTMMRPLNNFALTWEEITLHEDREGGMFELDAHKNINRGIKARGPISPELARYLRAIRPFGATGLIHPNPKTGRAYVDIRKQWRRLVEIAGATLGYELRGKKADFFTFRHTGASHLGERNNPVLITKMMGDTNVKTVMAHYCDPDVFAMEEIVRDWTLPAVEVAAHEDAEPILN